MNAINIIAPYKYVGMWVFDDPRVGLVQEPFVSGVDTMIDRVVAAIPDPENGFVMIFSSVPFPGHQFRLDWRRYDGSGNWYHASDLDLEGGYVRRSYAIFRKRPIQSTCKSRVVNPRQAKLPSSYSELFPISIAYPRPSFANRA